MRIDDLPEAPARPHNFFALESVDVPVNHPERETPILSTRSIQRVPFGSSSALGTCSAESTPLAFRYPAFQVVTLYDGFSVILMLY